MKVGNICDAISRSPDPGHIKLVFLRYIGPFRPITKSSLSEDDSKKMEEPTDYDETVLGYTIPAKKKGGFRFFGKGKAKNVKIEEVDVAEE